MSSIYENIVILANKHGFSISEVERRAGLSNGSIGKWTTSSPTVANLEKVATVLKVSLNTLLKRK